MIDERKTLALASAYRFALRQPIVTASLIADLELTPECDEMLRGSVNHLWHGILTPEDGGSRPIALDPARKSWLLLHAGLLRGVNLGLITSWRASGDSLEEIESAYPGFLEFGSALHALHGQDASRLVAGGGGGRSAVKRVADESRELLRLGLRRGLSLGYLLDIALSSSDEPTGSAGAVQSIRRCLAARSTPDDPDTIALLVANGANFATERGQEALDSLLGSESSRCAFEDVIGAISRARPLAVPSTIGRYSEAFVRLMLARLIGWWFAAGLAAGSAGGEAVTTTSVVTVWRRYSVRRWVEAQSLAWAREEAAEMLVVAGESAEALKWRLAGLTQRAAALGWRAAAGS